MKREKERERKALRPIESALRKELYSKTSIE